MAKYEIKADNSVLIWFDENVEPGIFQPHHPDGRNWNNKSEADAWAKNMIAEFENTVARDNELKSALESAKAKLAALGLTPDEIAALSK